MLDVISGGRLVAGFPVGTPMDTNFCYGAVAGDPARQVPRGRRADHAGVERARAVRVQRQVHPAALRQHLAAADPEAAPAGLDAGRRQVETWDWCLEHDFLYAYLSYFGYQRGQKIMDGFWERSTATSCRATRTAPASCSSSPSPTTTPRPRALRRAGALLLQALPARLSRASRIRPATLMATLQAGIGARSPRITNRAGARAEMATLSWKDLSSAAISWRAARRRSPIASTTWPTSSTSAIS